MGDVAPGVGGRHIWPVKPPPPHHWSKVEAEGFDIRIDDTSSTRNSLDALKELLSRYVAHYEIKLLNAKRCRKFVEGQRDATRFELERAKEQLCQIQKAGLAPPPNELAPPCKAIDSLEKLTEQGQQPSSTAAIPSAPVAKPPPVTLAEKVQPLSSTVASLSTSVAVAKPPPAKLRPSQDSWTSAISPQPPAKPKPKPTPSDSWVASASPSTNPRQSLEPWALNEDCFPEKERVQSTSLAEGPPMQHLNYEHTWHAGVLQQIAVSQASTGVPEAPGMQAHHPIASSSAELSSWSRAEAIRLDSSYFAQAPGIWPTNVPLQNTLEYGYHHPEVSIPSCTHFGSSAMPGYAEFTDSEASSWVSPSFEQHDTMAAPSAQDTQLQTAQPPLARKKRNKII